jgi:plastocyanin
VKPPTPALALVLLLPAIASAEIHQVRVVDNEFVPSFVTIAPGDTVEWSAEAPLHTVTASDGSFDSEEIPAGSTFSITFPTVGTVPYYCSNHGAPDGSGMAGVVRVVASTANTPPDTPTNVSPASGATGVSTSPTLQASPFVDADPGDVHVASQWLVTSGGLTTLDSGEDAQSRTSIQLADLAANTTYEWRVRYRDDRGAWSAYSPATQFTTAAPVQGSGSGLLGTYSKYNLRKNEVTFVTTRLDPEVDFDWGSDRAHPLLPTNNFHVVWEGTVLPEFSERYRLRIQADGGVRLWIGGELLIDDWIAAPFTLYRSATASLEADIPTPIRIEYFDTTKDADIKLRWSSRSQVLELIPTARLFPPP